ncbi:hypothetical protein WN943_015480 [Citrus x changshan-huyou]
MDSMTLRFSRVFREADGVADCLSNLGAMEPKLLPLYWYTPGVFRCFNLLAGILFSFAEVRLFNSQLLIAIRGCGVNCLHHEHPGNYDVCLSFRETVLLQLGAWMNLLRLLNGRTRHVRQQLVFPIFYDVEPTVVRKHIGSFQEAIANHEEVLKGEYRKGAKMERRSARGG